jgi:peptide methionine sulfoxide reductase msrA/msrB
MKYINYFFILGLIFIIIIGCNKVKTQHNKLTSEEEQVIVHKGTEIPFSGKYDNFHGIGTYTCKRCNARLFRSEDKFDSGCGWPSFDSEIPGAVKRISDADGVRTEIQCANCGAHLGHVFLNEGLTPKNTRHCVNSISMNFIPDEQNTNTVKTDTAIFAGGCFWGVEYYFQKSKGVLSTNVGYIGGHKDNPTYEEVCSGKTGHLEATQIIFDPTQTTYENLAKLFFEIHDPTQANGQGPDIGEQYLSSVFYLNDEQKQTAEKLINILKNKGYKVATQLIKATTFWKAEDYHQKYYEKKESLPYCHIYTKRF